jgi:hypothetical protein
MELIQLKMPPDRVELLADMIERDIKDSEDREEVQALTQVLTWLRYRLARWQAAHPPAPLE